MSIKPKINSLRCQKWYGFAKQKIAIWKELGLASKAYIIDGYKILLKNLINLAVISAPPGLAIFRKGDGEMEIYYADMYGFAKEKAVKVRSLKVSSGEVVNPAEVGWAGNMVPIAKGFFDNITLFFGARPDFSVSGPYITGFEYPSLFAVNNIVAAVGGIILRGGVISYVDGRVVGQVASICFVDDEFLYAIYQDGRLLDSGARNLVYGFGDFEPGYKAGSLLLNVKDLENTLPLAWTDGTRYHDVLPYYTYCWRSHNYTLGQDEGHVLALVNGSRGTSPIVYDDCLFLFLKYNKTTHDLDYLGYTDGANVKVLDSNIPTSGGKLYGLYIAGQPTTQYNYDKGNCFLWFPLAFGEMAMIMFNSTLNTINTAVKVALNESNTPYLITSLDIPYVWSDYIRPFCTRVSEELPSLYLYWEEELAFGGYETNILNLKYGSPYAGWLDFPPLGADYSLVNFTPIKMTWDERIFLGILHKHSGLNQGMYTALLDTNRSTSWFVGKQFKDSRIDRCVPTVFGEHPYVETRKSYHGTQFAWENSYSDNF